MKKITLLCFLFLSLHGYGQVKEDYQNPLLAAYLAGTITITCYGLNNSGAWENDMLPKIGNGTLYIGSVLFIFGTAEYIKQHRKPKRKGLSLSPGVTGASLSYRF